ncbi:MAG: LpxD N-terminal domain-containing protein [Saprospiraceae bacterium]|nr:LpxD N-terminal domain-containing protein [Saprospiraceae bacterium]
MKFPRQYTVSELADLCGAELIGSGDTLLSGMNEIHKVEPGDLMFVDNEKYFQKSLQSAASAILINKKMDPPADKILLYHTQPFDAYNFLAWHFRPSIYCTEAISSLAHIDPSAVIEPGVIIAPFARIGARTIIQANTYIGSYTEIGEEVMIQPGCVIGSDAFYYHKENQEYTAWRSIGKVVIKDRVEVGAATTIVRGVSGETVIGEGTKLDCQVHIGHGAVIGKNCLLAAQAALGGKVTLGDEVIVYGQVGIAQNITIGDRAILLAKTGVSKDLAGDNTYFGVPALPVREAYKQLATLRMVTDKTKERS